MLLRGIHMVAAGLMLAGCSQQPAPATGSMAPASAPNTPAARLERLAWNTAWAQTCGFYFDNLKLKSTYLAFEANAGMPADQVSRLGPAYDRTQGSLRAIAAAHGDDCTEARLGRIRASIARYLAGDFSPGEAA